MAGLAPAAVAVAAVEAAGLCWAVEARGRRMAGGACHQAHLQTGLPGLGLGAGR